MTEEVFDSNIVLDFLNGVAEARDALFGSERPAISILTQIEMLAGAHTANEEAQARALLGNLEVFPLTTAIAEQTAAIRRQRRRKLPDAVIQATALVHGCTLVTRNTKDFDRDDPTIRVPYEL